MIDQHHRRLLIIGDDGPDELSWQHERLGNYFGEFVRVSLLENGSVFGSSTESPDGKNLVVKLCGSRHMAVNLRPYDAALWSITEHGPFDAVLVGPDKSLKLEDIRSSGAYAMACLSADISSTILFSVERCSSIEGKSARLTARLLSRLFEEMKQPSRRMRSAGSSMILWVKVYGSMVAAQRYAYVSRVGFGQSRTPMARRNEKKAGLIEFKVLKI